MQNTSSYSWFPLTALWFGAAMSVAEIHTGGLMAAAGASTGIAALLAGHVLGSLLLGLMGYMGFKESMPSLMCTRISFGTQGSWILSVANILQLLGWTTVMIQQNSQAVGGITRTLWGIEATSAAIVTLGVLIAIWALWETQGKHTGNTIAVVLLALLACVITYTLWRKGVDTQGTLQPLAAADLSTIAASPTPTLGFISAFELSLIMPLSWTPLVADYASRAKSLRTACLAPALGYFVGSTWMYGLGFAGAFITGEANPTPMLMAAGLGIAALSVLVLSTIATTFLDVYSIVATARNIVPTLSMKKTGLAAVTIGTTAALFWESSLYIHFLSAIGAIFAPLGAILFTDYFLLRIDNRKKRASWPGIVSLGCGAATYLLASSFFASVSPSLACLLLTLGVHISLRKLCPGQ